MLIPKCLISDSIKRYAEVKPQHKAVRDGSRAESLDPEKRQAIYADLLASTHNPQIAANALERIIAGNDLQGVNYLAIGTRTAVSVGRISLLNPSGQLIGYATGFLAAPGVLMTNNHVFGSDIEAHNAFIEFDYELDVNGRDKRPVSFGFDARQFITEKALDFSVVAVADRSRDAAKAIGEYGYLPLKSRPGKALEGEYLTIIQHPGGERKQVCVRENRLIKYLDDTLWYETDTLGGSSGSPVCNGFWEVVALHHSGVPATDKDGRTLSVDGRVWDESMGEDKIKWIANEGIRISRILDCLATAHAAHPLAQKILSAGQNPAPLVAATPETASGAAVIANNGQITVTIPLPLALQGQPSGAPPAPAGLGLLSVSAPEAPGIEKVVIDQSNYAKRPGYDENFLGDGALKVPLPVLPPKLKLLAVKKTAKDTAPYVLAYYNYSLVMHAKRRLAFYSAVNINGPLRRSTGKREGDTWYLDPRIPAKYQVGGDFYKAVKIGVASDENEAARVSVFDRGHLVRRLDATWGPTEAIAKRNGDDTFHFTNCSPQHYQFNQGATLWAGIEDYVLSHVENAQAKACVINGPVFRDDDAVAGGVKIPRQFFKIAVFAKGDKLAAAGFVLSQADLLKRDMVADKTRAEELRPLSDDAAEAFQVKIAKIAQLTGLNFGPLATKDAAMEAFEEELVPQPLGSLGDIVF